jgi:hypothetical protein
MRSCRECHDEDSDLDPSGRCVDRGECWERVVSGAFTVLEYAKMDTYEQAKLYKQSPKMGDKT